MTFQNPEYLFLLLLLAPVVFWYFWKIRKSDASLQISSLQTLDKIAKSARVRLMFLPFIFRVLAIVFVVLTLARPQFSNSWNSKNIEGIDIVMALDISGTMLAEDLKPTRLEAAKAVATDFILSRPDDNIGLVIFSGESFTQCPLTSDHASLVNLFKSVNYGMIEDGTAIGLGLANAVNRIKDGKAKSKVVILLTDGSNNSGDIAPITAAEIAHTFGIRVYTIGVGSHGMVNIKVPTPYGMQTTQMESEFDEKILQEIAALTGGQYFRATNNAKLKSIYNEIDQMEKTKIRVQEFSKKNEVFHIFAVLALICIILEFLLRRIYLRRIP